MKIITVFCLLSFLLLGHEDIPGNGTIQEKPLLSFIHATDLHYELSLDNQMPLANRRILCLLNDIKRLNNTFPLDFVIFSGDITNEGAASKKELEEAKKLYNSLGIPYYTVAGNHDLAPNRKIATRYPGKEVYHEGPVETSNYANVFGASALRFEFEKYDYAFIGVSLRNDENDKTLEWLEQQINQTEKKIILIAHYGLYPPRDKGPLLKWGFARIEAILPKFRRIVDNAGNKIIIYLYGHNHINSVVKRNGVYYISSGGIQRGCTGYRLFKCYKDKIEVSFYPLSDKKLNNFQFWGINMPEQCIDTTHKNIEEYHRGNEDEQFFVIKQ